MKHRLTVITGMACLMVVGGCANKETMLPRPDQTMAQVYSAAMGSTGQARLMDERRVLRRSLTESDTDYSPFVRSQANQLAVTFKRLANPTLYMFVAPHLSTRDGVPVPGYLTEFTLYTRVHYALPGEVNLNE